MKKKTLTHRFTSSTTFASTGPLVLVAVLYEVLGVAIAWVVGRFFWVPHRFRYGLLIAGGWGNVGDLGTFINFPYRTLPNQ